jgi:DNA-binding transcriptional LysR family regulator
MHNRTIVDDAFKRAGVFARPVIETNSVLTLGLTVLVGDVCSILPGTLVNVMRGYGELEGVPLKTPEIRIPIGFIYAKSQRRSHALQAALDMAIDPIWVTHFRDHSGWLKP